MPFLTTKQEATDEMNAGQKVFKPTSDKFLNGSTKLLVLKSRYGSRATTCMQRLFNNHYPGRVLFNTHRHTISYDIMRDFEKF